MIAAPYLDTALAFGDACGLSREWLTSLFAFAPEADAHYVTRERSRAGEWKANGTGGFAEFSSAVVAQSRPSFVPAEARREMLAFLEASARRRGSRMLT